MCSKTGELPLVDGPDDYSVFVPNNHTVIRVSDFAGLKALADYLLLENDQALYGSYFNYKPPTSHYDPAFLAADLDWDIALSEGCTASGGSPGGWRAAGGPQEGDAA
jgi:hypothetical protein